MLLSDVSLTSVCHVHRA